MTDEDFLARWSRRKRAAEQDRQAGQAAPPAQPVSSEAEKPGEQATSDASKPERQDEETIDLASLPPIESITSATDVTAFLRQGVPPELTRAALRRAWGADPAIRDFIGLAENAWDFNDPTAIPGFGPLDQTPDQTRRMLSGLIDDVREAADQAGEVMSVPADRNPSAETSMSAAVKQAEAQDGERRHEAADSSTADDAAGVPEGGARDIASQHDDLQQPAPRPRRSHGGALPQ